MSVFIILKRKGSVTSPSNASQLYWPGSLSPVFLFLRAQTPKSKRWQLEKNNKKTIERDQQLGRAEVQH